MLATTQLPAVDKTSILPAELRRIRSDNLFEQGRLLIIEHAGSEYLLRITRQGKLILTK